MTFSRPSMQTLISDLGVCIFHVQHSHVMLDTFVKTSLCRISEKQLLFIDQKLLEIQLFRAKN
jgi:hypothetical protein